MIIAMITINDALMDKNATLHVTYSIYLIYVLIHSTYLVLYHRTRNAAHRGKEFKMLARR